MVESPDVAREMVNLAGEIDPSLLELDRKGRIAIDLAGALQRSFCNELGIDQVPEKTKSQIH